MGRASESGATRPGLPAKPGTLASEAHRPAEASGTYRRMPQKGSGGSCIRVKSSICLDSQISAAHPLPFLGVVNRNKKRRVRWFTIDPEVRRLRMVD